MKTDGYCDSSCGCTYCSPIAGSSLMNVTYQLRIREKGQKDLYLDATILELDKRTLEADLAILNVMEKALKDLYERKSINDTI